MKSEYVWRQPHVGHRNSLGVGRFLDDRMRMGQVKDYIEHRLTDFTLYTVKVRKDYVAVFDQTFQMMWPSVKMVKPGEGDGKKAA